MAAAVPLPENKPLLCPVPIRPPGVHVQFRAITLVPVLRLFSPRGPPRTDHLRSWPAAAACQRSGRSFRRACAARGSPSGPFPCGDRTRLFAAGTWISGGSGRTAPKENKHHGDRKTRRLYAHHKHDRELPREGRAALDKAVESGVRRRQDRTAAAPQRTALRRDQRPHTLGQRRRAGLHCTRLDDL